MKTTYWITGALVLALGAAGAASAHGFGDKSRGEDRGAMMMFDRFDTDGDGTITQAEIDALRATQFAAADADGDGFLTAEEMAAHADKMRAERRAERMNDMLGRLDTDGDGKLSAEEAAAAGPVTMFERLDANEDGAISREEIAEARGKMRGMGEGRGRHERGEGHGRGDGQGRGVEGRGMPWWMH